MPLNETQNNETCETNRLTSRSIRSFVIRNGRTTPAQSDAIKRLMPELGINFQQERLDLNQTFDRHAPTWVEIGFGNGDALLNMATENPDTNLIGVEVHTAGIGHALLGVEQQQLANVRLIQHDALEVLEHMLEPGQIDKVLLFFPDPWHKKRHHKRRILQADFLNAVHRVLRPDGILHCATDWAEYGQWMIEHLEADTRYANVAGAGNASSRPQWRPLTRFEKRGHRLGHSVLDLVYRKV